MKQVIAIVKPFLAEKVLEGVKHILAEAISEPVELGIAPLAHAQADG